MECIQKKRLTQREINTQIKLIVQKVSDTNLYQKYLIVFFMILSLNIAISNFGLPLFYMNPNFQCEGYQNTVYEEVACDRLSLCKLKNDFTLTAKLNLYCGARKNDRNFIQSASGIGAWIGIVFAGYVGDNKGKKLGMIIAFGLAVIAALSRILGAFSQSVMILMISETLTSVANRSLFMFSFVLMTRFLAKSHYEIASIVWLIAGGGFGQTSIALINQFLPGWLNLVIIITIPTFLFFVISFFILQEDPIFLFSQGKYEQLRQVIANVAETNQASPAAIKQSHQMLIQLENQVSDCTEIDQQNSQIIQRQRSPKLKLKITFDLVFFFLAVGFCGMSSSLIFACIQYSSQNIGVSYNVNLITMGVAQILGYFTMTLIIQRQINRRMGIILFSFIYGALGFFFLFQFCKNSGTLQTILIFLLRYFGSFITAFLVRVKVDSFPQRLQISLMGIIQVLTMLGKILGPQFVQMSLDRSINPLISSNIVLIALGTIPIIFINEQILKNPQMESDQQTFEDNQKSKKIITDQKIK